MQSEGQPWLAVADLHGRRDRLEALVAWGDARMSGWRLALLGDYVDSGPDIPGLLDLIPRLATERGDALVAIAGNHDAVCSRCLETLGTEEGEFWAQKWRRGHWSSQGDTPGRYGAAYGDVAGLVARMPPGHRRFLTGLPWFFDTGRWLFVHAGMEAGPIAPQLDRLRERPAGPGLRFEKGLDRGLPATIRGHTLDNTTDAAWDRVVVTAHSSHHRTPAWEGPNRIAFHANDNPSEDVYAIRLPDRVYLLLRRGGKVVVA